MPSRVNARRAYRSPLREDQARETRRRILAAAEELFLARGYASTTIAAVAERAGVSTDTVYVSVGGKQRLLEGVMSHRREDPEDPAQADQQRRREEIAGLTDSRDRLRRLVGLSCETLARVSPIYDLIRGAADDHAWAVEMRERMLQRRLEVQGQNLRTFLGPHRRKDLTEAEAARRYSALLSPELYQLLTVECGWSLPQYEGWVAELLEHDLLHACRGAVTVREPSTRR